jgi:excisionase family DNA binding protein
MDEERYWSPREIAEKLHVNVSTVTRWITSGQLKAIRAGKQWRVADSAIREFVERQEDQG